LNEVKPNRYLKSGVRVMQYRRSRAKGATFFFTVVTHDRKKILCNEKSVSRLEKGEQGVWQRRFWEHQIRNEVNFVRYVEYIHYNPVKHGLVRSPCDWPYSSFHRYVKQGIYDSDWGSGVEMKFDTKVEYE